VHSGKLTEFLEEVGYREIGGDHCRTTRGPWELGDRGT
jgi:hypothetical protein